jgi:hypothetical protein
MLDLSGDDEILGRAVVNTVINFGFHKKRVDF